MAKEELTLRFCAEMRSCALQCLAEPDEAWDACCPWSSTETSSLRISDNPQSLAALIEIFPFMVYTL